MNTFGTIEGITSIVVPITTGDSRTFAPGGGLPLWRVLVATHAIESPKGNTPSGLRVVYTEQAYVKGYPDLPDPIHWPRIGDHVGWGMQDNCVCWIPYGQGGRYLLPVVGPAWDPTNLEQRKERESSWLK